MREGIAIAGTALVDHIHEIDAYPAEGQLTQIRKVSRAVGGCVPNVAIDLKRMSPNLPVLAVGCIGRDADGDYMLETLTAEGVNVRHMRKMDTPTSYTDVMSVCGGQRTFFTYPGACAEFGFDALDMDALSVKMLHLGYLFLLDRVDRGDGLRILQAAHERGIVTSIDLVSDPSGDREMVIACLPYIDHLIVNEWEAGMLCGIQPTIDNLPVMARTIRDMGVRGCVVIHTPEMGICQSENGCFALPSFDLPVDWIQGSTGAGDAFCAGALLGIYEGADEMTMLMRASEAATASLTVTDSISGLRNAVEIHALCQHLNRREV